MPRVKRKSKRRTAGFTDWHVQELLTGICYGFMDAEEAFHGDENAQREGWEVLRDTLLPKFIEENPGARPWAWWAFDAPEMRRCLNRDKPVDMGGFYYGLPRGWSRENAGEVYETQVAYLDRHGLLTADERDHPAVRDEIDSFGRRQT